MPDDFAAADEGAQLDELDFEHQAQPPDRPSADAPPADQPPAPEDDSEFWEQVAERLDPETLAAFEQAVEGGHQSEPGPSDGEIWSQLEALAEEDPLQAANVISQIRAQQIEEKMQQALEPVLARERDQEAGEHVARLEQEFGEYLDKAELGRMVEASPDKFLASDGSIDADALHQAAELLALRAGADYRAGGDVIRGIDGAAAAESRDTFGTQRTAQGPGRDGRGRFASRAGNVHVEGGSGPQPAAPVDNTDPVIAEMDDTDAGSDAFGRRLVR